MTKSSLDSKDQAKVVTLLSGFEGVEFNGLHVTADLKLKFDLTSQRGTYTMSCERLIKDKVNPRIQLFLRPKGDMNKLRLSLRGVKV